MLSISGQVSRSAVESTLSVLGNSASKLILVRFSEKFGSAEYLDANGVSDWLKAYFGADCTSLLMRGMQLGTFCKKEGVI